MLLTVFTLTFKLVLYGLVIVIGTVSYIVVRMRNAGNRSKGLKFVRSLKEGTADLDAVRSELIFTAAKMDVNQIDAEKIKNITVGQKIRGTRGSFTIEHILPTPQKELLITTIGTLHDYAVVGPSENPKYEQVDTHLFLFRTDVEGKYFEVKCEVYKTLDEKRFRIEFAQSLLEYLRKTEN